MIRETNAGYFDDALEFFGLKLQLPRALLFLSSTLQYRSLSVPHPPKGSLFRLVGF